MADDPEAVRELFIKTSGLPRPAAENAPILAHAFAFDQGDTLVENVQMWEDVLKDLGEFKGDIDPAEAVAPTE
jgi:hypothetical protein